MQWTVPTNPWLREPRFSTTSWLLAISGSPTGQDELRFHTRLLVGEQEANESRMTKVTDERATTIRHDSLGSFSAADSTLE